MGGLAAARVLADRVTRRRQVPAAVAAAATGLGRRRRAARQEAGDVVAARQQLAATARRVIFVVRVLVVVDGDERNEGRLAATVEVASTTAPVDGVATATLHRQHHAVAVA